MIYILAVLGILLFLSPAAMLVYLLFRDDGVQKGAEGLSILLNIHRK